MVFIGGNGEKGRDTRPSIMMWSIMFHGSKHTIFLYMAFDGYATSFDSFHGLRDLRTRVIVFACRICCLCFALRYEDRCAICCK